MDTAVPFQAEAAELQGHPTPGDDPGYEGKAISTPPERIISAIRKALEQAPGLIETGIVLAGGSALLRNLDRFISGDCGLPMRPAQYPFSASFEGSLTN